MKNGLFNTEKKGMISCRWSTNKNSGLNKPISRVTVPLTDWYVAFEIFTGGLV